MKTRFALLAGYLLFAAPALVFSAELVIPQGTVVFGELDERITSNGKKFRVGYPVDAHVWKDVVVDGHTVIAAGTPLVMRISELKESGTGGRGGGLEVMAVSVKAQDGTEITLRGGYDRAGEDRFGLARGVSMILWPAAFLPGRRAVLDVGTVFDASIPANTRVTVPDNELPTLRLTDRPDLSVDILYDDIDQREGSLPFELTLCNKPFTREASVTAVNDKEIRPILVTIISGKQGDPCHVFGARVNLEALREHFSAGINRFSVTMSGAVGTTVLNVEM
jgi:hypothetical protein